MTRRPHIPGRVLLTALFALALYLLIALNMAGCAPAKNSNKLFARPKYELSTRKNAHNGVPTVRQDWWEDRWFWQRRYTPYPIEKRP